MNLTKSVQSQRSRRWGYSLALVFAVFATVGATCEGDESTDEQGDADELDEAEPEEGSDEPPAPSATPMKQGNDHVV